MTTTARLAGGIAALVLALPVSPAGASSPTAPVKAGGSILLTGATSYVREIVISRTVTISGETSSKVEASRGRFAGFALRRATEDDPGVFFDIQEGGCDTKGCQRVPWAFGGTCVCGGYRSATPPPAGTATLAPGRYRLYLIADGGPVTVHLTLHGLPGRTTIRSGRPHPVVIAAPPGQGSPDGGSLLYSAGGAHASGAWGGLHYLLLRKMLVSPPKSANHGGACLSDHPPSGGPLGPYQFPCEPGTVGGQVETDRTLGPLNLTKQYATQISFFGIHGEGDWSLGGYLNSEFPATEAHAQLLWMDF
jgi:hypothetical protein